MYLIGPVLIVVCMAGFYGYYYLIKPKLKDDPNKGFEEFEQQYPPRKGEESNLAFGVLVINALGSEPTRSLQMKTPIEKVKTFDLERSWNIYHQEDAKKVLNQLAQLYAGDEVNTRLFFTPELRASWIALEEGQLSKAEAKQAYEVYNSSVPSQIQAVLNELAQPGMKYKFSELMKVDSVVAWDLERLAGIARKCYYVGYITEDECYEYLQLAADEAKKHYRSWRDYFAGYLMGRSLLYSDEGFGQWVYTARGQLETPNSIWNEQQQIWG